MFNDPLPTDDPAGQAVRLALAMRSRMADLLQDWRKIGHVLDFGVGIDLGYATLGTIGFEGKTEYGPIGTVARLAARLCDLAADQQILVSHRIHVATDELVQSTSLGEPAIAGFTRPVSVYAVQRVRGAGVAEPATSASPAADTGPLTDREREVVNLIVQGCTNREISEALVIAEGTAVRHGQHFEQAATAFARASGGVGRATDPTVCALTGLSAELRRRACGRLDVPCSRV